MANAGLADANVQYLTLGSGLLTLFEQNRLLIDLLLEDNARERVTISFINASPLARLEALDPLPGKLNIFKGSDPDGWKTNLERFAGLRYRELYPGVDLLYQPGRAALKGTFTLQPGADPDQIRWRYEGVVELALEAESGDLLLSLDSKDEIRETIPAAWQEVDGQHKPVAVHYRLQPEGSVGFAVGKYDRTRPLIIDPTLERSSFVGGDKEDSATIRVGQDGSIYLAGTTKSTNFPTLPNRLGIGGSEDIFIQKIDPSTNTVLFSTLIGGSKLEDVNFELGPGGTLYLAGRTESSDFPLVNPLQPVYGGGYGDGYFLKLGAQGDQLLFSTYLGGNDHDTLNDLAVNQAGHALIVGQTSSTNLTTVNAFDDTYGGNSDALLIRIDPDTPELLSLSFLGGDEVESVFSIALDSGENVYLAGATVSYNFPLVNPYNSIKHGSFDAFLAKMSPAMDQLLYSTFLGGNYTEDDAVVTVDKEGNMYTLIRSYSQSEGNGFPMVNSMNPTPYSAYDLVLAKLSPDGSQLLYSTFISGFSEENVGNISVDQDGTIYATFRSNSKCLPGIYPLNQEGESEMGYLALIKPDGSPPVYITRLGKVHSPGNPDLVLQNEAVYLAGKTIDPQFPLLNPLDSTFAGSEEGFWQKYTLLPQPLVGDYLIHLPLLANPLPSYGIHGFLTKNDCPVENQAVELRFYDGKTWTTRASATTDIFGMYSFKNIPSLGFGQKYYVLFTNKAENDAYLGSYGSPLLIAYAGGSDAFLGYGEISSFGPYQPPNQTAINLPYQFNWWKSPTRHGRSYEMILAYDDLSKTWSSGYLGDVETYNLTKLPSGFKIQTWYLWFVGAADAYGGYGNSRYAYWVGFNDSSSLQAGEADSLAQPRDERWLDPLFLPGR